MASCAKGYQPCRQQGGQRGHSFPLPGGLEVLNTTQLLAAVPAGGLGITCLSFSPPFPQGRPWILGGGSWTDPASLPPSCPAEREMILSRSQPGTRAERGTGWAAAGVSRAGELLHVGSRAAANPSGLPDNGALVTSAHARQVRARCERSSAWGRSSRRARRGGRHPPPPRAAGCRLHGRQEWDWGGPGGHGDAHGAGEPQPPPCLTSPSRNALRSHPVPLEATTIRPSWGSCGSMGKSPRASSPASRSAGRTCRTTHSHYSFRQRLVSEPACVEEMMRGGGGCRKTFAGLTGGRTGGTK